MIVKPHHFGPLGPEDGGPTAPGEVFPGADRYLSAKERKRSTALRDLVAERVTSLLEPGEAVLYIAPGYQVPPTLDGLGFGAYVIEYHRVALVFTERRLLELLLEFKGKRLSTRARSFAWGEVQSIKAGWRKLAVTTRDGKRHRFGVPGRGDRKVLGLLVPRLSERVLGVPAASPTAAGRTPVWHCPTCGKGLAPKPRRCEACGTAFRSPAVATWLALAFPGGGLYYAGHRGLGTVDLIGELVLFGIVAINIASMATWSEVMGYAGFALFLLVATKVESVHLARVLTARTKPIPAGGEGGWRKLAAAGAVASLAAILAVPAVQGVAAGRVDHDLAFAVEADGWTGSFDRDAWEFMGEEPHARSEWYHEDGSVVVVVAYELAPFQTFGDVERDFRESVRGEAQPEPERLDVNGLEGLRMVQRRRDDSGSEFASLRYVVFDRDGRDWHYVVWNMEVGEEVKARPRMDALVAKARWVDAQSAQPTEVAAAIGAR